MPENNTRRDGVTDTWASGSRRSLLKALGVSAGLSVLGSASAVAQETTTQRDDTPEIDPVFGLPLAPNEDVPDGIDPVQVVELAIEEENIHPGFPLEPDPEEPERFAEIPAEFFFDPVGVQISPGDVVHYQSVSPTHTVTAFHEKFGEERFPMPNRVPDGVPGFTSPVLMAEDSWLYEFTEPGVYDILCLPHLGLGMVQRIVVVDPETDEVPAAPSGEVSPNVQAVLTAPELDPQNLVEAGTVGWSDLTLEMQTPTGTTTVTETTTTS